MNEGVDPAPYIQRINELTQDLHNALDEIDDLNEEIQTDTETIAQQASSIQQLNQQVSDLTTRNTALTTALNTYENGTFTLESKSYFTYRTNVNFTDPIVNQVFNSGTYFTIGITFSGGEAYIYLDGNNSHANDYDVSESYTWYANPDITTPITSSLGARSTMKTVASTPLPWFNAYHIRYAITSDSYPIYVHGFYNDQNQPYYALFYIVIDVSIHVANITHHLYPCPQSYQLSNTDYYDNPYELYQENA